MMAYLRGESRDQISLLPESLEDYVSANAVVRFIDRFVESQDMKSLGFNRIYLSSTGRPPYSPDCLLRLYIYGYLHQHRSSRQLARQTRCNVELMWLLEKLTPEFKTISDFRKDNGAAIGRVVSQFRQFCRELGLYGEQLVAIDGSFFKASNGKDQVLSQKKLDKELARIEKQVEEYLEEMERNDALEQDEVALTAEELEEKIRQMEEMQKRSQENREQHQSLVEAGEQYRCLTDEDARMLRKNGKSVIGYNVQIAVDDKHHLIASHDVTVDGNDAKQLSPMAQQAKENLAAKQLDVVADSGYHSRVELQNCVEEKITPYVATRDTSSSKSQGRYGKEDFDYDGQQDIYRCPAGEELSFVGTGKSKTGLIMRRYRTRQCTDCRLRSQCLKPETAFKRQDRWEHEHFVEENAARVDAHPEMMSRRKALAEHPFGTFKHWMGAQHFLTRRKPNVRTEMDLTVLSYNIKRAINVLGVEYLIEALDRRSRPT
jgi:transposase